MTKAPESVIHDFERPPVVEVALSVQFQSLRRLRPFELRAFWESRKAQYPTYEEHPPLGRIVLDSVDEGRAQMALQLEVSLLPPPVRYWFLNAAQTHLLQVQHDRFGVNWRRKSPGDEYPRFSRIRETFMTELEHFLAFLKSEDLGSLEPDACEVTYVNHVSPPSDEDMSAWLASVVRPWRGMLDGCRVGGVGEVMLQWRHRVPSSQGQPGGALGVIISPALNSATGETVLAMQMVSRGRPTSGAPDDIAAFMDAGRRWIVEGFVDMTTPFAHRIWGRTQ
jgi:uncharacterized protein (TIGR04255 family)